MSTRAKRLSIVAALSPLACVAMFAVAGPSAGIATVILVFIATTWGAYVMNADGPRDSQSSFGLALWIAIVLLVFPGASLLGAYAVLQGLINWLLEN